MNYSNFKSLACVLANTINKKRRERRNPSLGYFAHSYIWNIWM